MLFNSFHFVVFFAVVFLLVAILRHRVTARNAVLLIASYYFYGCWDWRFLGLIFISTIVDYICGLLLDVKRVDPNHNIDRNRRDSFVLVVSLITNLGILGFFKYYDFFVVSATDLLNSLGFHAHASTLNIILPVGISFYTFQTLSYTIDLYRGRIETERSLLNFALYVAFFPQLVAGPIERAKNLLPQIRTPRPMTWPAFYSGFYLIGWGLFKKVVLADNVAAVVDHVFAMESPSFATTLIGVYSFAVQIYCDFSGYTDIARGAARILGFDLMLNFNLPYFALNPSDFWSRWHISLSSWLRDYLYIPLGGNRQGLARTYFNLMATMVLGGLWHGAAWTFIIWGVYHGILLCAHRMIRPFIQNRVGPTSRPGITIWYAVKLLAFFHLTCLGWLFFRAQSVTQIQSMLGSILSNSGWLTPDMSPAMMLTAAVCCGLLAIVQLVQYVSGDLNVIFRFPVPVRAFIYALAAIGFVVFGNFAGEPFIYFQF